MTVSVGAGQPMALDLEMYSQTDFAEIARQQAHEKFFSLIAFTFDPVLFRYAGQEPAT